jgi:gliding motility-associated-like protein
MYRLKYFAFLICCLSWVTGHAQSTNKVWIFGWGAGLDFNTTPATPILSGVHSLEGVASVSNSAGQLLMSAYGDTVYNKLHNPMPNGAGILGTLVYGSCTQGVLIVPKPGSTTQYYLFTLEGLSDAIYTGRLFYNLVDMTLAGGLGDVVATEKRIQIDTALGEKLVAVAGTCNNVWVLVIPSSGKEVHAFEVTASGVHATPVVSPLPLPLNPGDYDFGVLKATHNGKKLVASNYNLRTYDMFDFDNTTGVVSGPTFIISNGTGSSSYGACFSPDDSKLYVTFDSLFQYDLSLSSSAAIQNSAVGLSHSIISGSLPGDMQTAPDGKIYLATQNATFLSTIDFPNQAGTGCTFSPMSVTLPAPSKSILGLPNVIVNAANSGASNSIDTVVCENFTVQSSSGTGPYLWNTGDTTRGLEINTPGKYWVSSLAPCGNTDTFKVSFWNKRIHIRDTFGCSGEQMRISVHVDIAPGESVRWSTGEVVADITIRDTGVYWIEASINSCFSSDTFRITTQSCGCKIVMPTAFSPNNDGLNDRFQPLFDDGCIKSQYLLQVYNRWGQVVFRGYNPSQGWDGIYDGVLAEVGVYFYFIQLTDIKGKRILKGDMTLLK